MMADAEDVTDDKQRQQHTEDRVNGQHQSQQGNGHKANPAAKAGFANPDDKRCDSPDGRNTARGLAQARRTILSSRPVSSGMEHSGHMASQPTSQRTAISAPIMPARSAVRPAARA